MKTNLIQVSIVYLGVGTFFSIAASGLATVAYWYKLVGWPDYPSIILVSYSLPALKFGIYLAGRASKMTRVPEHPASRQIPMNINGKDKTLFMSAVSWAVGKSEPDKNESRFVFWEEGMASIINEDQLYKFCQTVWRRYQQARFGSLDFNKVFSRNYFTQQNRPRLSKPDYVSIMYILASRNLIRGRWQGKAGTPRYPPGLTLEEAKKRWHN